MPALTCTNPVVFDFSQGDHGECQFVVELTYDGVSAPPNCNGVASRVKWNNATDVTAKPTTFYAHLPATRLGPAVYQLLPGSVGNVTNRTILHAAGLDDRSDLISGVNGLSVSEIPPQAGEILLNP